MWRPLITTMLIDCMAAIPRHPGQGFHHERREREEDAGDQPAAERRDQGQAEQPGVAHRRANASTRGGHGQARRLDAVLE